MTQLERATAPTLYFFGVTTAKSSIMKVFPAWAKQLGLRDAVIKGVDFPLHAPPDAYRAAVTFLKNDPHSLGALVTTHKIDLYHACRDLFDDIDPHARLHGRNKLPLEAGREARLPRQGPDFVRPRARRLPARAAFRTNRRRGLFAWAPAARPSR